MKLDWKQVDSSAIRAVAYEDGKLLIEFNTGDRYVYQNVPLEIYNELVQAESIGKYHARKIKNVFTYAKLT